jgi:adenylate kinase family enzyme
MACADPHRPFAPLARMTATAHYSSGHTQASVAALYALLPPCLSIVKMPRIVVLGNTAGGKSTLARQLSKKRGLPHIEIDRLYWQADWSVTPREIYEREHAEEIKDDDWIIDGGGDLASIRAQIDRATEIILIDMPLWVHFWLAAERQILWASGKIEHPPAGIADMPPTGRLFQIIWEVDRDWMPTVRTLCDEQGAKGKVVTRLNSINDLNAFAQAN